jgi:hypothetical protein
MERNERFVADGVAIRARGGRIRALAALAVLGASTCAVAQRQSLTIDEVPMTLVDASGRARVVDLGQITVSLASRGGAGMSAVFRVDEGFQPDQAGGDLWDHVEIHWVNIITDDDCPATMRGVPAGRSALPFPVVDMPRNGWDYVYKSRRASRGRGPERTENNADGREMRDDARDIWPWYHTPEEEAMQDGSGNETAGFGQFKRGVVYGIRDLPSLCGRGGVTAFTTLLVAVVPPNQDGRGVGTLGQGQLLVLAGFDWDWTTRDLRLAETEFTLDDLDQALLNSHFPEWTGVADVAVAVEHWAGSGPEPEPRDDDAPSGGPGPGGREPAVERRDRPRRGALSGDKPKRAAIGAD